MTEETKLRESFIGRFENRRAATGDQTGDAGYLAVVLGERDRSPQIIIASKPTLRGLLDDLRGPRSRAIESSRVIFAPPAAFKTASYGLLVVPISLTPEEIIGVKDALRLP